MANRSWLPPAGSLEVDVVELFCNFVVGASGAVGATTGKGITSVTRNSAGNYTILLADRYNALLFASTSQMDATAEDPATVGVHTRLASEAINSASPSLVIQCFNGDDGAADDPADGSVIYVHLKVRNSSVS